MVLMVLVVAGVGRIWAGSGAGNAVGEERRLEGGTEESVDGKALSDGMSSLDTVDSEWRDAQWR